MIMVMLMMNQIETEKKRERGIRKQVTKALLSSRCTVCLFLRGYFNLFRYHSGCFPVDQNSGTIYGR